MSRRYHSAGDQTVTTGLLTVGGLASATTIRPGIYFMNFGSTSSPADYVLRWLVQRFTAVGTSTAVAPTPIDPADPAALAAFGSNHTAEPTYTSATTLLDIGLAQRNTYPWYGDQSPLVAPATASNGIGVQVIGSTGGAEAKVSVHHAE